MKLLKNLHWFEIAIIIVVMSAHLYTALTDSANFPSRWFTRDDAYYYFKVAQNISEGRGSTFDGVNPTNGYHPLWMLVCIPIFALARFDLILPLRVLMLVMAALGAASSILLFRLLRRAKLPQAVAMLAAAWWAFNLNVHSIITQQGMETGLLAFSIVLFLILLQKFDRTWRAAPVTWRDILPLTLAAMLVLFSRLDTIYLVLLAGVWIIFRGHPARALLPVDLLAATSFIILGYVLRAELKIYLLAFASSAILMAALTFVLQTVVFYFFGLYQQPKPVMLPKLLIKTTAAAGLASLLSAGMMLVLNSLGVAEMPRAVPFYYFGAMLLFSLLSRWIYGTVSPWPVSPPKQSRSPLEELRRDWKRWLEEGLAYYGSLGAALLAYMLTNRALFGTFMPVSGQIKRWWGSLANDVYGGGAKSLLDVFALDPERSKPWETLTAPLLELARQLSTENALNLYWWIALLAATAFVALIFTQTRKSLPALSSLGWILLTAAAQWQGFFYGAMAYAAQHEWYWVMQMYAIVIGLAFTAGNLLQRLPRHRVAEIAILGLAALLSLGMAFQFIIALVNRMPWHAQQAEQPYMDILPILEKYTEPGSVIGMTGGGNVGYYIKDRTIVNMDGLINSYAYFKAMKAGRGGEYLENMGLDYVFANPYILVNSMPYRPMFRDHIRPVPGAPAYGRKELWRYIP